MAEVFIQCDFSVENPEQNIKCLRIIAGYIVLDNENKDVLMVVYGYGGGGVQESRIYKIRHKNKKLIEIYYGYVFSDIWERKYVEEQEYESGEYLSNEDSKVIEKIYFELDNWIIPASSFEDNDNEDTDYYFKLSMKDQLSQLDDNTNLFETSNFQIKYFEHVQENDWPFITTF